MADGAGWKYYKEKCKVLLIFSQEKCVYPYDCITDDSALAPNCHHSCFPAQPATGFAGGATDCAVPECKEQGLSPLCPGKHPSLLLALEEFFPGSAWDCRRHTAFPWLCSPSTYSWSILTADTTRNAEIYERARIATSLCPLRIQQKLTLPFANIISRSEAVALFRRKSTLKGQMF